VKYTDPDGRLFLVDDFIFSAVGNIFGLRDDGVFAGTWKNFTNSWALVASKIITPGSLIEMRRLLCGG
jgi:hypothetical protein